MSTALQEYNLESAQRIPEGSNRHSAVDSHANMLVPETVSSAMPKCGYCGISALTFSQCGTTGQSLTQAHVIIIDTNLEKLLMGGSMDTLLQLSHYRLINSKPSPTKIVQLQFILTLGSDDIFPISCRT